MKRWLSETGRNPCPYTTFEVTDYAASEVTDEIKKLLSDLLIKNRFAEGFLEKASKRLPWEVLKKVEKAMMPADSKVQRGDFGEVVSTAILTQFSGYEVPVPKARYSITGSQTQPSTDVLALKFNEARTKIAEVCFVESKLRTTASKQTAVKGYEQLRKDREQIMPHMLIFVANRLHDGDDPLGDLVLSHMADRGAAVESTVLTLVYEKSVWSEETLANLEAIPPAMKPFSVRVVQVSDLAALTDELFKGMGAAQIVDDDDDKESE